MNKKRLLLITGILLMISVELSAQLESFKMEDSTFLQDLQLIRNKYHSLSFTGYLQVQYQYAQSKGIQSYNGGDFLPTTDNRFMIRRGRLRADYERRNEAGDLKYYFALQFDGNERGSVGIRDMFGRLYENKWNCFVATVGMFNRPFGYELNYSSASRESPERGRMSQIIMKSERDLGFMLSFDPQKSSNKISFLKIDAAIFNGQGLTGSGDFDHFKDFVGRISVRRLKLGSNLIFSGGVSHLNGGFRTGSRYTYNTEALTPDIYSMVADISINHIEEKSPRVYSGADAQLVINTQLGKTELRAEYIRGTQSATFRSSETPGSPPLNKFGKADSIYTRQFDGAYLYLLHTFLKKHQLLIKYDWYDPNTHVSANEVDEKLGFSSADIRYQTLGIGYVYYMHENAKLIFYYDHPMNETSKIKNFGSDIADNTFTCRIQFKF